MIEFLYCGHGTFASSLLESMKMLLPETKGVHVVDFNSEMDTTELQTRIRKVLESNKDKSVLVVNDIVGGAPFKLCAVESLDYPNVRVVAGLNLAALLEIYFIRDKDIDEVLEVAIKTSIDSIDYFPKKD